MAEKLMTAQDLCDYLVIPRGTLYQWRTRGKGPRSIKVGKELRFRRSDVEAWLESHSDPRSK